MAGDAGLAGPDAGSAGSGPRRTGRPSSASSSGPASKESKTVSGAAGQPPPRFCRHRAGYDHYLLVASSNCQTYTLLHVIMEAQHAISSSAGRGVGDCGGVLVNCLGVGSCERRPSTLSVVGGHLGRRPIFRNCVFDTTTMYHPGGVGVTPLTHFHRPNKLINLNLSSQSFVNIKLNNPAPPNPSPPAHCPEKLNNPVIIRRQRP